MKVWTSSGARVWVRDSKFAMVTVGTVLYQCSKIHNFPTSGRKRRRKRLLTIIIGASTLSVLSCNNNKWLNIYVSPQLLLKKTTERTKYRILQSPGQEYFLSRCFEAVDMTGLTAVKTLVKHCPHIQQMQPGPLRWNSIFMTPTLTCFYSLATKTKKEKRNSYITWKGCVIRNFLLLRVPWGYFTWMTMPSCGSVIVSASCRLSCIILEMVYFKHVTNKTTYIKKSRMAQWLTLTLLLSDSSASTCLRLISCCDLKPDLKCTLASNG